MGVAGYVERVLQKDLKLLNKQGNMEFTLLAEGIRKLALLWLLIQNGTLLLKPALEDTSCTYTRKKHPPSEAKQEHPTRLPKAV